MAASSRRLIIWLRMRAIRRCGSAVPIGAAGAANAALFAVAMLATGNPALRARLDAFRARQTAAAVAMTSELT